MADYRIRILVDPSGAAAGSRAAATAVEGIGSAADRANERVGGLMSGLGGLGGALKIAAIIAALHKYAEITDEIKQANAQLKLATRTQDDLNNSQARAYAIAQRNGTAYGATATLLAKNLKAANALGLQGAAAAEKARAATSAVSAAIRVSGTNAEEAKGSLFQLGQALASGTLRGDELNSVMEGIPAITDALAKAVGKTSGELRKMGAEGKLTSAFVLEGLAKAEPELKKLADMIPLTFGGAMTKVKNSIGSMLAGFDGETSLSAGMIAALDIVSRTLDTLSEHAQAVSNTIVGVMVAMALKSVVSFRAAGAAALSQAKANVELAATANAAAVAQQRQAVASLAVARATRGFGGISAAQAAANVASASAKVAETSAALKGAQAAAAGAASSAGLFGAAMTRAAGLARAGLALVGGPIGLLVAGLIALALYAGKAALSFKPIEGSAAEVRDYVGAAFDVLGEKVTKTIEDIRKWWEANSADMYASFRQFAVNAINAVVSIAAPAFQVAAGIAGAFAAALNNTSAVFKGFALDAANALKGGTPSLDNTRAAIAGAKNLGSAYRDAAAEAGKITANATGEKAVAAVETFVKSVPGRIARAFQATGLRGRAEERARLRAEQARGGLGEVGKPTPPEAKKDKDKPHKETFEDILKRAKEEAEAAKLTTAERERQEAVLAAQKSLKRDLTASEADQLKSAIRLRQTNEANVALESATKDAIEGAAKARMEAAAQARREAGDLGGAAVITAEIAVQEKLNQAKRDGITLDAAKLEAYRQAVLLSAQEGETLRKQEETRRALREIADDARRSIREAISGGIQDALSGKLSVGGLFKTFGNILKKQFAEQVTYSIFQGAADQSSVTSQAINLVTPAATALAAATNIVTGSLRGAANDNNPVATAMETGAAQVQTASDQLSGTLSGAVAPMSEALRGLLGLFGLMGKGSLMGGGNAAPTTGVGRFFGPTGPLSKGLDKLAGVLGIKGKTNADGSVTSAGSRFLGKAASGLMIGNAAGGLVGMLGLKTSSTGSSLGGVAGSFIGGPIGAAIGGALGGIVGGLFKKTKQASSTITINNGVASAGEVRGSGGKTGAAASALAGSVADQLNSAAKLLGASLSDVGVSVGYRPGHKEGAYRVDTTGQGKLTGVTAFEDQQDAIEFAVKTAIQKGVFTGLSAGVSDALKRGAATVQEAADFMSTTKDINRKAKALTDPVGAAIDELDDQFNALRSQYKLFGESTVNLEKVYQDQRKKVIEDATSKELDVLRQFRTDLTTTDLGGLSYMDQFKAQDKALSAIEAAKASGGTVNADQLNTVGRALLEATQQLEGNTPAYQAQVDRVMKLLNSVIDGSGATNVTSLAPTIDTAPLISASDATTAAVNNQTQELVEAIRSVGAQSIRNTSATNDKLEALNARGYSALTGDFQVQNFA